MTELIWDGKYTPDHKKNAPVRLALPFQDVETVNESAQTRNLMLDLWGSNRPAEWRNRLIWGDKKYVLPSLLPEFAGKINLIYIDPPFATGADFSFTANVPDDPETEGDQSATFTKQPSLIEQKAYRDTWGRGLDGYLQWFYETAVLLHELLADKGSLYVHCDGRVNSYVRLVLDEVFGPDMYRNEISWKRTNAHGNADNKFGAITDYILFYAKSADTTLNTLYQSYTNTEIEDSFPYIEEKTGRRYASKNITNYNKDRPNLNYEWHGHRRTWLFTIEKMRELDAAGRIIYSAKTGFPRMKQYADESPGKPIGDIWLDISALKHAGNEVLGYPTQKPEALLERIIKASSNEGDLVLDCFCGSGTTAAVAEKLGRRWITADLGRFAIHTARKRLLSIPDVRPFVVQNLGKYERQAWQSAEFGQDKEKAALAQARYRRFILNLYGAEPLEGYTRLHGVKAGHLVHVGSVDTPVLIGDIKAIAQEFWKAAGKQSGATTNTVDVLGWDFAFEINELAKQMAAEANIKMAFKRIPREVLEKKAVEQGDIRFFELAALDAHVHTNKRSVHVELCDFIVPPDDVPAEVQKAITHWSQWIDYWAIDWDYKGDTFHNQWQSYRTKKSPRLQLNAAHTYEAGGSYTIIIKVIDILGNDTTRSVQVEVK